MEGTKNGVVAEMLGMRRYGDHYFAVLHLRPWDGKDTRRYGYTGITFEVAWSYIEGCN